LAELDLSERVLNLLTEAGYENAGGLMEQLGMDADRVLAIDGFGPKAMEELQEKLSAHTFPEVVVEEPEPVAAEAESAEGAVEVEAAAVEGEEAVPAGVEVEAVAVPAEGEAPAAEPESLEQAFEAISREIAASIVAAAADDEESEDKDVQTEPGKKKKKRKKGARAMEFDPESGSMVVRKRRKPGRGGWEEL
jgi:hypothetical protein